LLNIVSLNNTEATVYTAPSGKTVFLTLDIFPTSGTPNVTVKINNGSDYTYYTASSIADMLSFKLAIKDGQLIKVQTNGQVNVFVYGIEV